MRANQRLTRLAALLLKAPPDTWRGLGCGPWGGVPVNVQVSITGTDMNKNSWQSRRRHGRGSHQQNPWFRLRDPEDRSDSQAAQSAQDSSHGDDESPSTSSGTAGASSVPELPGFVLLYTGVKEMTRRINVRMAEKTTKIPAVV
ncbi:hypothetical protein H8959_019123 [Pygathrix nigripes]